MKRLTYFLATTLLLISVVACNNIDGKPPLMRNQAYNKSAFIKSPEKLATLHSLTDLDGTGRLYEINYTSDYKLEDALNSNVKDTKMLMKFIIEHLFDSIPDSTYYAKLSFTPGCSAFAIPDAESIDFLMGRNYDFCHTSDGVNYDHISAFVVHTAPSGGKKSISLVDGNNFKFKRGMPTDTCSDISMLIGLPYGVLDGINEDGFAIGVLSLRENPTVQDEPNKRSINTTIAMRLLLDRCSTVKQAIDTLRKYNMQMTNMPGQRNNYHYYMADATGDYAIVEYVYDKNLPDKANPSKMEIYTNNDSLRYATNFYVSPNMVGTTDGWGSEHGKARYETLKNVLATKGYSLKPDDAMALLKAVSQPPSTGDPTSQTQWSALYNLSDKSVRLSILRQYGTEYKFKVGQVGAIND